MKFDLFIFFSYCCYYYLWLRWIRLWCSPFVRVLIASIGSRANGEFERNQSNDFGRIGQVFYTIRHRVAHRISSMVHFNLC